MILMEDIIRDGHPTLREVAKEVEIPLSNEDTKTLSDMLEYLKHSQDEELATKYKLRPGVGLAAPQINVSKRMIAIYVENEDGNDDEYVIVNPKIVSHSEEMIYLSTGEGCLSVDRDVNGFTPRYARVTIEGYNLNNEKIKVRASEFLAIVFQHEIDHLNGVMFYDTIVEDPKNLRMI